MDSSTITRHFGSGIQGRTLVRIHASLTTVSLMSSLTAAKSVVSLQGNMTSPSKESVFSGIVNISSVRLGFFIAELNGL
jgi:hypothetical protein